MAATEKRSFTLPAERSASIDDLIAGGTYASASEVVRAGLRALLGGRDIGLAFP